MLRRFWYLERIQITFNVKRGKLVFKFIPRIYQDGVCIQDALQPIPTTDQKFRKKIGS
jgi:hypothetical protein